MKKKLIIVAVILSNSVFGQIPGKPIDGPVVLFDTLTVKKGDILYLGKGSDQATGNFVYIYAPKNNTLPIAKEVLSGFFSKKEFNAKPIPRKNLDKGFTGKQLVIESFGKVSSKKTGDKMLAVINMKEYQLIEGIFFNNAVAELEAAIQSGEIIHISAPALPENATADLLFTPFEMTKNGIDPMVVAFNNLSKTELYNKAIKWTQTYYNNPDQATITNRMKK